MEPLVLYVLKMIACSAILFAYYLFFLKDKTFHHYNRFYLLMTVIISLLLPLVKVSYFTVELTPKYYLLFNQFNINTISDDQNSGINIYPILYTVVGVVSVFLIARLLLGLKKIQTIKSQFPNEEIEGIRFYQTNLHDAPFSFFKNLFWKNSIDMASPLGKQILKHEMVHIEQKHTWDKLLMQSVKAVFWFNPVFYFIHKEINLIHEYLADHKAVRKSDTKVFAQMLLESHFTGAGLPATSSFLSSNLKKRLKMLTKSKTKYSYARKIFALPILFFVVFAYMVNAKNKEIKATNKAIEMVFQKQQSDTIKVADESKTAEAEKRSEAEQAAKVIKEKSAEIAELSQKIKDKSTALSEMAQSQKMDVAEYKKLGKEISKMASQLESLGMSENFNGVFKRLSENEDWVWFYNNSDLKKHLEEAEKNAKILEQKYNNPEFKKMIEKTRITSDSLAKIFDRLGNVDRVIVKHFKNTKPFSDDVFRLERNIDDMLLDKMNLTEKERKKLERHKRQLKEKQKELEELKKEILKKRNKDMVDRNWADDVEVFMTRSPKVTVVAPPVLPPPTPKGLLSISTAETNGAVKYYLNGKEVSKAEIDQVKPENIKKMHVDTTNNNGVKSTEIRIETK